MSDTLLEFFQTSLFPIITLVFAYVVFRSSRIPSTGSGTAIVRDTHKVNNLLSGGSLNSVFQVWAFVIGTYHALLAFYLFPSSSASFFALHENPLRPIPSLLCPNPDYLNPNLFSWTPYTIVCLIIGLVAGIARLQAYRMLGKNFTLQMTEPDRLVREGFYKYARHPGYALWALNWWSAITLLGRVDGASVSPFSLFSPDFFRNFFMFPWLVLLSTIFFILSLST